MKLTDVTKRDTVFERELSQHKFIELLENAAKNSHAALKHTPIFTDAPFKYQYSFVSPSVKKIKSPFWVDKMIQGYGNWNHFPDRQAFVRGFTNMEHVGNETSVIIPFDGVKLGICTGSTFYRSFGGLTDLGIKKLDNVAIGDWITTIASGINKTLKTEISVDEIRSFENLNKRLIEIDKALDRLKLQRELTKADDITDTEHVMLRDLLRRYTTTMDLYLREKLDPNTNGFSLHRVEGISNLHGDREVWFTQLCLVIKRTDYIELMKE